MVDSPSITYARHPDATPEGETTALANVYAFILDCHAKKKGTGPGAPDDGTKVKEVSADAPIIRR